MTLNDKYRIHNKTKKTKILRLYILIVLSFIFASTMARYTNSSDLSIGVGIAKWNLKINDVEVTPQTTTLNNEIKMIVTKNADENGYLKAGQEGYFDIKIEPKYTEVSIEYEIKINTENLPDEIQILNYSINSSNEKIDMPQNNKITGKILINEKEMLEEEDTRTYRVYWKWDGQDSKIQVKNYKIKANIEIKQVID